MLAASGDATVVARNQTKARSHSVEATEGKDHGQNPGHTPFSGTSANIGENLLRYKQGKAFRNVGLRSSRMPQRQQRVSRDNLHQIILPHLVDEAAPSQRDWASPLLR